MIWIVRSHDGAYHFAENCNARFSQYDAMCDFFLFLWDGHLVRPFWAGKMPTPQWNQGLTKLSCTRRNMCIYIHEQLRLKINCPLGN